MLYIIPGYIGEILPTSMLSVFTVYMQSEVWSPQNKLVFEQERLF